jgi:hypothetical protein
VRIIYKSLIVAAAWITVGFLRMPFEAALAKSCVEQRLTAPKIDIGTREKIGQTSSAVALGGLRTLVATFLNLRAHTLFTEQKWPEVARTYDLLVDLAPRTGYYWESGSWHQAYNAASYYLNDSKLPPLRRREAWRSSIFAGKNFLERGIRNNPDDWRLHANLGFLLSDPNKFPAFPDQNECFRQAAEAYGKANETGNALGYIKRSHLYALARTQGCEAEALALARKLYKIGGKNHTATLLCLLYTLEAWEKPHAQPAQRATAVFGSAQKAYDALSNYWMRTRERFPVHGVSAALEELENQLNIPAKESIFQKPPAPPWDPYDMFGQE